MATPPDFTNGTALDASSLDKIGLWRVARVAIGSAVTSVTVSNCFSTDFQSYRIVVRGCTATNIDWLKLTLSGASGLSYAFNIPYYNYTTAGTFYYLSAGANHIGLCVTGTTMSGIMDVHNPYESQTTAFYTVGSSETYENAGGGYNSQAVSSTGFTLTPNAGTITGGTITVYGYNNMA